MLFVQAESCVRVRIYSQITLMSINFILNIGVLGCVCVLGAVTGGHLFLNVEIFSVVSQLK